MDDNQLEQEALAQIDEQKIREEVVAELGFDEVNDSERIDKAVAREVKTRTIAAKAIGSKIKTREELETIKNDPRLKETPKGSNNVDPEEFDKRVSDTVSKTLEQRDLEELAYPDDIKSAIKRVAAMDGVSIRQAKSDPLIQARISAYEKERKAEEASASNKHKSGAKQESSFENPPDVDTKTPEGREQWEKYKADLRKQGL